MLEEAFGDIHDQLMDEPESDEANNAMASLMEEISEKWEEIQSKISGARKFDNYSAVGIEEEEKETRGDDVCEVNDYTRLACKHTLSGHTQLIFLFNNHPKIIKNRTKAGSVIVM